MIVEAEADAHGDAFSVHRTTDVEKKVCAVKNRITTGVSGK